MIRSFKHKGLKKFFETGSTAGIDAKQAKKIALRLSVLDLAKVIDDVDPTRLLLAPANGRSQRTMVRHRNRQLAYHV